MAPAARCPEDWASKRALTLPNASSGSSAAIAVVRCDSASGLLSRSMAKSSSVNPPAFSFSAKTIEAVLVKDQPVAKESRGQAVHFTACVFAASASARARSARIPGLPLVARSRAWARESGTSSAPSAVGEAMRAISRQKSHDLPNIRPLLAIRPSLQVMRARRARKDSGGSSAFPVARAWMLRLHRSLDPWVRHEPHQGHRHEDAIGDELVHEREGNGGDVHHQ